MKFEIDDKTGMITTEECIRHDEVNNTHEASIFHFHLETILQAVKKTQEKLVNKQIQEIQDSKNQDFQYAECIVDKEEPFEIRKGPNGKTFSIKNIKFTARYDDKLSITYEYAGDKESAELYIESLRKGCSNSIQSNEKIEQNQKIVDNLKATYIEWCDPTNYPQEDELTKSIKTELESLIYISTGKDIKEL